MSKVSDGTYPAATSVVPTALGYLYDPTDPTNPDKTISLAVLAKVPSVVKQSAFDAVLTIGAVVSHVRAISIQLNDGNGNALTRQAVVDLVVFSSAAATALASAPTTGFAIASNGLIIATPVTKLVHRVISDATGLITLTWTDTTPVTAYLGVVLQDGRLVTPQVITSA